MQPAVAGCCRLACSNKAVRGLPHKNFLISKIFDFSVVFNLKLRQRSNDDNEPPSFKTS